MALPSDSSSVAPSSLLGARIIASTLTQSRLLSRTMSSTPRVQSPTRAASALGATRMVSSWTRVPRRASAEAVGVEANVAMRMTAAARVWRQLPNREFRLAGVSPPSSRAIAIMELAPKSETILELQSLTGKIFNPKELDLFACPAPEAELGILRLAPWRAQVKRKSGRYRKSEL